MRYGFAPTESIQKRLKQYDFYTPVNIAPTGLPENSFEAHSGATEIRQRYLQGKKYLFCTVSRLAKEKIFPSCFKVLQKQKNSQEIFSM